MLGAVRRTQHRIDFRRLSREESQQVCDGILRLRHSPMFCLLVPPATDNGLDLRHMIGRIRKLYDQLSILPRSDLNRS